VPARVRSPWVVTMSSDVKSTSTLTRCAGWPPLPLRAGVAVGDLHRPERIRWPSGPLRRRRGRQRARTTQHGGNLIEHKILLDLWWVCVSTFLLVIDHYSKPCEWITGSDRSLYKLGGRSFSLAS
jgi:hypothetical protein